MKNPFRKFSIAHRALPAALAVTLAGGLALNSVSAEPVKKHILIGFVNNNEPGFRPEVLRPTLLYLQKALPHYLFRTIDIAAYQAAEDVRRTQPDFVVAPSDVFWLLSDHGGQPLAVLKPARAADANASLGSTLVAREDRTDISKLSDLKGKTVSASLPDSLGGWLALAGELESQGLDHETFFKSVRFRAFHIPDVVADVLNGRVDAGILSTCQLEVAEAEGLIEPGQLKVINEKYDEGFRCAHSSSLYPGQIFGLSSKRLSADTVKEINLALLQMPPEAFEKGADSGFSWQVPAGHDPVSKLYRTLELGPWAYLRDRTLSGIWKRWSSQILFVVGILLLLAVNEIRLVHLVRKRTDSLKRLVAEKEEIIQEVRRLAARLNSMERNSLVSQMSSVIAHELKQPIASIINYTAVIGYGLEDKGLDDTRIALANDAVSREAHRISQIVDRVRSYVKTTEKRHTACDLTQLARRAYESFRHYSASKADVELELENNLAINADDLEIEIMILNLLKNAARAALKGRNAQVILRTYRQGTKSVLEVCDNGPALDEEGIVKLREALDGTSGGLGAEGLGLGLGIVRSIIDEHSATLQLEQLVPCGVCIRVLFDRPQN